MKLTVIILTWNSKKYIRECLNSLYSGIRGVNSEIVIVDNGSNDGSIDIIETEYPEVILIKNKYNVGIAPARNQGISVAKGEYILILDVDTFTFPDTIKTLLDYMEDNNDVGLCAPKLIFPDYTIQKSCRRFPVIHMKLLRRLDTNWAKKLLENENYSSEMAGEAPFQVDYVIGACQVIRKTIIYKVGLLDDNIFYGPEDVDFCLRIWFSGHRVVYLPHVKIIHYEQRITKRKILSKVMLEHIKGLVYYFWKYKYMVSRKKIYTKIKSII